MEDKLNKMVYLLEMILKEMKTETVKVTEVGSKESYSLEDTTRLVDQIRLKDLNEPQKEFLDSVFNYAVKCNGEPVTLTEYDLMAIVSDLVARQGRHDRDIQAIKDAMGTVVKKPEQPVLKLPKLNQVAADVNPVKLQ